MAKYSRFKLMLMPDFCDWLLHEPRSITLLYLMMTAFCTGCLLHCRFCYGVTLNSLLLEWHVLLFGVAVDAKYCGAGDCYIYLTMDRLLCRLCSRFVCLTIQPILLEWHFTHRE